MPQKHALDFGNIQFFIVTCDFLSFGPCASAHLNVFYEKSWLTILLYGSWICLKLFYWPIFYLVVRVHSFNSITIIERLNSCTTKIVQCVHGLNVSDFAHLLQMIKIRVYYNLKVHPHYATRQNATHCSFAAQQKLLGICCQFNRIHIKKEIFAKVAETVEWDQWTPSNLFL